MYTPEIVSSAEYPDIRIALGLDSTDTTTLPDAVIASRPYLQYVEVEVQATITAWSTILSGGGDRAASLLAGVVLATSARLASMWLGARAGSEVKSQGLGPATVAFRQGPDWEALSKRLMGEAAAALHRAEYWTEGLQSMTLVGRAGPTRKARTDSKQLSLRTLVERLTPEAVKGFEYTSHEHEETL